MPEPIRQLADARVFLETLDGVDVGLAFYDREGRLVHRNLLMERAVEVGGAGAELREELERLVLHGNAEVLAAANGRLPPAEVREITIVDVSAGDRRFRVRLSYVGMDLFGHGPSVLVSLRPHALAPDDVLRDRFGLTPREVRVARLLGQGWSNARIARDLSISPHTARHHTEKVLAKLGLSSRSQVGPLLGGITSP